MFLINLILKMLLDEEFINLAKKSLDEEQQKELEAFIRCLKAWENDKEKREKFLQIFLDEFTRELKQNNKTDFEKFVDFSEKIQELQKKYLELDKLDK